MSRDLAVAQRKNIYIAADLSTAANANINVQIQVPFASDAMIVKNFSYGGDSGGANIRVYQLVSTLIDDQTLVTFTNVAQTEHFDTKFDLDSRKVVSGTYNFQVQDLPATNFTGTGSVTTHANGQYGVIIEFIQYQDLHRYGRKDQPR